jgi:replicative DNA helicase
MNKSNHSTHAQNNGPQSMDTALAQSMADLNRTHNCEEATPAIGIHTGFTDLDRLISKLSPDSLIVIAGRPEMEKLAFTLNIASHIAMEQQLPVAIFSMELSSQQVAAKLLGRSGKMDPHHLHAENLDDVDAKNLGAALDKVMGAKIIIDDTSPLNSEQLGSRIRALYAQRGQLGLVIVNYLQLIDKLDQQNYGELMASLKSMAKDINVPIVVISHLRRNLESKMDKRPTLSDFIDKSIEPEADLVLFIYRDEIYYENSPNKGTAEIIIGKNRCGPIGTVRLDFNGETCKFSNIHSLKEALINCHLE